MNHWFDFTDPWCLQYGHRAIAPIPDADGNMTVPIHTQLSASAPKTTGLESYGPSHKPLTCPCTVCAAHIPVCSPNSQKCSEHVQRLSRNLAYIRRGLNHGIPVAVTTFVG